MMSLQKVSALVFLVLLFVQNGLSMEQEMETNTFPPNGKDPVDNYYYEIGPISNSLGSIEFKIKFKKNDYLLFANAHTIFTMCLCFSSSDSDMLYLGYCTHPQTSRLCFSNGEWWTRNDQNGYFTSSDVAASSTDVEITATFKLPPTSPEVYISSEQLAIKNFLLKYPNFNPHTKESGEIWYRIAAFSTHKDNVHFSLVTPQLTMNLLNPPPSTQKPDTTTLPTSTSKITSTEILSSSKGDDVASASTGTVVGIVVGVILGIIVIIIIIFVILRLCHGVWYCGFIQKKKRSDEDNAPPESVVVDNNSKEGASKKLTKLSDERKEAPPPSSTRTKQHPIVSATEGQLPPSQANEPEKEAVAPPAVPPPPPPPPPPPAKKNAFVSRDTKGTTNNSKTTEAETSATTGETSAAPTEVKKKRERPPNVILLATKDEDALDDKARQKNKVQRKNKEPLATKNATQDPQGVETGVAKTKTNKGGEKFVTGVPKSETDLNDPPGGNLFTGKAKTTTTKGVSNTQGGKVTENYETRPTQRTNTMMTGALVGTTQAGTRTTQAATKQTREMATGVTRGATGVTQMQTGDVDATQNQTGVLRTGTTQGGTRTTQFGTGATQKHTTGTTQAATGTTQAGTLMATGITQRGTNPTQARTSGTRATGETQNPEEADIDPTQVKTGGRTTGGTRPSAGTQIPSDAEADPTQNPTAFTGGAGRTSRTQLGTGTTQQGTTKTRTRATQPTHQN